jgi:probable rRNA maturation factor
MPTLELYDHQCTLILELQRMLETATRALPMVLAHPGNHEALLAELEEVEVSFVTDAIISQAHDRFMGDASPTDVITFHHGEILISTDTALRQAAEHFTDPQRECALYLIHGLLHLHGHDDRDPAEAASMHKVQENIMQQVWI